MVISEGLLVEQLRELALTYTVPEVGRDEFTVSMFMAATGMERNPAEGTIAKAKKAGGIAYVGDRVANGKRVKAYKFVNS